MQVTHRDRLQSLKKSLRVVRPARGAPCLQEAGFRRLELVALLCPFRIFRVCDGADCEECVCHCNADAQILGLCSDLPKRGDRLRVWNLAERLYP